MHVAQKLVHTQVALSEWLLDQSLLTDPFRSGPDLTTKRLIEADVVFLGTHEVWYEMYASKATQDSDHIQFDIQLTSDRPLPQSTVLNIAYDTFSLQVPLSPQGSGRWSLQESDVIDRKSRIVRGPGRIELSV